MKKFQDTYSLKEGLVLRYYKKNFGYGILKIIHNNEHFITTLTSQKTFNHLKINDTLKMYLWTDNKGAYEWQSKVIGKIDDTNFVLFKHSKKLNWLKDKNFLILKTNLLLKFFIYNIHQKENKHFFSTKTEMKKGKIIQITDNNAILHYASKIEANSILKGHINIKNEDIDLIGTILDYNLAENTYKISFSGTKEKDKNKILNYIFENYRE